MRVMAKTTPPPSVSQTTNVTVVAVAPPAPPPEKRSAVVVVQMPPLSVRADLGPRSINDGERTVELIITTTNGVRRVDWNTGKPYTEVLSMDPSHVRLDRINGGAPLLDSHSAYSVADILGTVVPGSVSMTKRAMLGTVRFSKREAVQPIWEDVKDGIVRSVSVGYMVHRYEEMPAKGDAPPIRLATDWEPYEASLVPVPADANAKVRGEAQGSTNPCEIVTAGAPAEEQTRSAEPAAQEETSMKPNERSETIVEQDPPVAKPAAAATEPNERDAGVIAERERVQGIHQACRAARLPVSIEERLIAEGLPLVKAQARVFEELAKRADPHPGVPAQTPSGDGGSGIIVGDDPIVHKRKGIENALLHRLAGDILGRDGKPVFPLDDEAREYRGMGLLDIAEVFLRARGIRITGMTKMDRAAAALGMSSRGGGMQTTTDFPYLLADAAHKVLRAAYEAAPQTWLPLAKMVSLSDFKASNQLQVGDAPALLEVKEHGEFTSGAITEAREQVQLKTYGRIFTITRQSLINDDTGAFAEVPASFGRAARSLESDLAWTQITSNPTMGDSVALFHAASHGNLALNGGAISVNHIGQGRAAMRVQKAIDGATLLNLNPNFLVVPAALETIADQFVSASLMASAPGSINPFAGRLQVIAEPRLDANSVTAWYLATNAAQCPVLLYATLDGQAGPNVTQELGFDVDGLKIKCREDVAFKAADYRAIYKNAGA